MFLQSCLGLKVTLYSGETDDLFFYSYFYLCIYLFIHLKEKARDACYNSDNKLFSHQQSMNDKLWIFFYHVGIGN